MSSSSGRSERSLALATRSGGASALSTMSPARSMRWRMAARTLVPTGWGSSPGVVLLCTRGAPQEGGGGRGGGPPQGDGLAHEALPAGLLGGKPRLGHGRPADPLSGGQEGTWLIGPLGGEAPNG